MNAGKVKVRHYPATQRELLDKFLSQLRSMGFIKPCPPAARQTAPPLVPEDSEYRIWITIYLGPVNATKKGEQWPMHIIESELSDDKDSKHFSSMDLYARYWQCPLDPGYYDACEIIAPKGTFVSALVLHSLKKASANFQTTISSLLEELKDNIKALIDDFTIDAKQNLSWWIILGISLQSVSNIIYDCQARIVHFTARK